MPDSTVQKLKALLQLANDGLNRDEFVKAFQAVLKVVVKVEEQLLTKIDTRLAKIKDGHTPTAGELTALIKPLIPPALKPQDGHTPTADELTALIEPLIPDPIPGDPGSPDTADDIRNKLELLPVGEKLKIDAIEDLQKELDELKKNVGKGGHQVVASQRGQVQVYDLSASLNGVLKTFTLPAFWRVIDVKLWSAPVLQPTTDYTTNASGPSITFTSQIDAATLLAAGQTCLVIYQTP